jgi:hypothetical protein
MPFLAPLTSLGLFVPSLSWDVIRDYVVAFGWTKGTLTIFFWLAHWWIYRTYNGRLRDRQEQINQLAAENRQYRERFLAIMDGHFDYDATKLGKVSRRKRLRGR